MQKKILLSLKYMFVDKDLIFWAPHAQLISEEKYFKMCSSSFSAEFENVYSLSNCRNIGFANYKLYSCNQLFINRKGAKGKTRNNRPCHLGSYTRKLQFHILQGTTSSFSTDHWKKGSNKGEIDECVVKMGCLREVPVNRTWEQKSLAGGGTSLWKFGDM